MQIKQVFLFLSITALAVVFRFTGLNWDQGTHLHPDERFLTMVAGSLKWPNSIAEYFATDRSPLNPHNQGFNFYVYGTWPVILVKGVAEAFGRGDYDRLTMVGRGLSAIFDLGTLILVFLIAKQLVLSFRSNEATKLQNYAPCWAMFLYASAVLPIQLSHFFTVDQFAVLFVSISLYLIVRGTFGILLGVAVGLAIGAKVSNILLLPFVFLTFIHEVFVPENHHVRRLTLPKKLFVYLVQGIVFSFALFLTLRVAYPYLFDGLTLNPKILANWKELASFDNPQTHFPPAVQWLGTKPWQPLFDLATWGLGLPYGILAILAVIWSVFTSLKRKKLDGVGLLTIWVLLVFFYQSTRFAKAMRYFISLYPALAVLTSLFLFQVLTTLKKHFSHFFIGPIGSIGLIGLIGLIFLWPLSFMSIYTRPHTRVTASRWIYANIPPGSTIAWEHWDDPLPLGVAGRDVTEYRTVQLPIYDPDSPEKWQRISSILAQTDYLVLSSNRVYGGTGRAASRYPMTNRYYQRLFDGSLGFVPVQQIVSRPTIPIPGLSSCLYLPGANYGLVADIIAACNADGIEVVDDNAEESFTVYDHPKVIIMQNREKLSNNDLYQRLYEQ